MPIMKWSPTIEAGHLLQALTIAGGIGMAGLTAYLTVVKLDSGTQIDIALLHQRLEQDEDTIKTIKLEHKQLVDTVSNGLDKLSTQLVDLKIAVAARGSDGKR